MATARITKRAVDAAHPASKDTYLWDDELSLRLHDLRHSFASVAASGGQSLIVIGKMLGHAQPNNGALRTPS
jgi:integrase